MMRLLFLLGVLACGTVLAEPRASVAFQEVAQVGGGPVVLGQLARIHSADLDLVRRLVRAPVAVDGRARDVDRALVAAAVARQLGLREGEIAWQGADATRVARASADGDGEAVVRVAVQALAGLLQTRGVAAAIHVRHAPRTLPPGAGGTQLQARPLDHLPLRRSMVVWVDVLDGERVSRTVPVSLEVHWQGGEPPQPVATAASAPHGPDRNLPLVTRGDWATLRASAGPILLESRVEVLQDGRTGDRIRVRQPGGGGLMFARVLGTGQLELAP